MGHDVVRDYRQARRALGVVPQELVYDPFFNVRETLRIQSGYFGLKHNEGWIDEVMHHLDLTQHADKNTQSLSGGMKRRLLVAQALVHKPPVIVLDEPTAGVDVDLRRSLWEFISRLNREGHTILLTTHYLEEAEALCGRIAMLKSGRVVALDATRNLLKLTNEHCAQLRLDSEVVPAAWQKRLQRDAGWQLALQFQRVFGPGDPAGRFARCRHARARNAAAGTRSGGCLYRHHEADMSGFSALFYKELLRFWKVVVQTVVAPVVTALLYLLIFSHVLEAHIEVYPGVSYTSFLVPGLVMMSMLQNAFANSSSSLIQSKMQGNIVFVLLPPLSYLEFFLAYLGAAIRAGWWSGWASGR